MLKKIILCIFLLILFSYVLEAQIAITNFRFSATAYIPDADPNGVISAVINPIQINSNGFITIFATTELSPTNVFVYFNGKTGTNMLYTNSSANNWTNTMHAFTNQTVYTANFIVYYSNLIVTNFNMAYYIVDNTPPQIISSSPADGTSIDLIDWDFNLTLNDNSSGINLTKTISNSMIIFAGLDNLFDTGDERTNHGVWSSISTNIIRFSPNLPATNGYYKVITFPVDQAGNTNYNMLNTNNHIVFQQVETFLIYNVYHPFDHNTQLIPEVPLTVFLKGSPGRTAYFSISGCDNIQNIPMTYLSNGIYKGVYIIEEDDYIQNGVITGYLKHNSFVKNMDSSVSIDIGPKILASRGKDIYVPAKDDICTKLFIPDNAFPYDVRMSISKVEQFGDRYAYDFSFNTYADNIPVEYFEKPITIYIHYDMKEDKVDKLNIKEEALQYDASLMFFDRVKWLKVGGAFDYENNLIYGNVKHFSIFALAMDDSNGKLVVAPNPFTPNKDNDFDRIHFNCDIKYGEPLQADIKIYSMDGFLIKALTLDDGTLNIRTVDIMWDGQDEYGEDCAPGLYVYQAKIGHRLYNGTFVLAR